MNIFTVTTDNSVRKIEYPKGHANFTDLLTRAVSEISESFDPNLVTGIADYADGTLSVYLVDYGSQEQYQNMSVMKSIKSETDGSVRTKYYFNNGNKRMAPMYSDKYLVGFATNDINDYITLYHTDIDGEVPSVLSNGFTSVTITPDGNVVSDYVPS